MPEPINKQLYQTVKNLANKKFTSPSGIYRSSWIVREYKKRGGKYSGSKSKSSGLKRWFKENWIDLNRPIKNSIGKIVGYHKCGRKSSKSTGKYPLCRPSRRVNSKTPKTYKQLSKNSIDKAKKLKQIYTYKKNIIFGKHSIKRSNKRSVKKRSVNRSTKKHSNKRSVHRSVKKRSVRRSTKKHSNKRSVHRSVKKRSRAIAKKRSA